MTVIGRDETPWCDPRLRDPDQSKGGDLNRAIENATRGREEIDRLRRQLQGAVEERDRLRAENERLRGELRSLRAAWDEHMKTCPQHASMRVPSFEEIDAWMKAPSDTASVPELVAMREDES